jgi:hypothetical protein
MGFDGKTITYAASAGDWGAAIVRLRRSWRWWPLLWLGPLGIGLVGVYAYLSGQWGLGGGLVGLALYMFATFNSARLNGLLIRGQLRSLVGQTVTITIAEDGLLFAAGPSTGTLDWSAVHDVIEDHRVVIITRFKTVSWAIIPRAAFDGPQEIEMFRGDIRRRRDLARQTQG